MTSTETDQGRRPTTAPGPARRRRAYRQDRNGPVFWIGMVILALIFIIPILWMFLTAFRTEEDTRRFP